VQTHLIRLEVHVVVSDLEQDADEIDQWDVVAEVSAIVVGPDALVVRQRLGQRDHQLDRYSEEAASLCQASAWAVRIERTVVDHLDVLVLGRAGQALAPEEVHPLPAMQPQQLVWSVSQVDRESTPLTSSSMREAFCVASFDRRWYARK